VKHFFYLLSLLLFLPTFNNAMAAEIMDDRGVKIALSSAPTRLVSLLPSITESLCAVGRCDLIVGVDEYSNYPSRVKSIARVGSALSPNLELIISLKPDLVLMSSNSRLSQRLEHLGIKVIVINTVHSSDVRESLSKLDLIFRSNLGQALWKSIDSKITEASQTLPNKSKNLRVYFEVSPGPYAADPKSFIGETLTRLGVSNIVPSDIGDFPKLNPEFIVKENPDLIIISDNNYSDLIKRPGWGEMTAIRKNRVCALTKEQSDIVVRPGPRMGEGAKIIAQCILSKGLNS